MLNISRCPVFIPRIAKLPHPVTQQHCERRRRRRRKSKKRRRRRRRKHLLKKIKRQVASVS